MDELPMSVVVATVFICVAIVAMSYVVNKLTYISKHQPLVDASDFERLRDMQRQGLSIPPLDWEYKSNIYSSDEYAVTVMPFDFDSGKHGRRLVQSASAWHQDKFIGSVQRKTGEKSVDTINRAKLIAERHAVGLPV